VPESRHNYLPVLALVVVVLSVVGSAIMLVSAKHQSRQLFVRLELLKEARDRLQVDWGRLKIEQSTLATHGRVEALVRERLSMVDPHAQEIVLVSAGEAD
jgi:cell division protein FtsL